MTRRSPHTVQYKDLVALAANVVAYRQRDYDAALARGAHNLDLYTHSLETAKVLHRMLKRGEPGRQTDLYALFEQVK